MIHEPPCRTSAEHMAHETDAGDTENEGLDEFTSRFVRERAAEKEREMGITRIMVAVHERDIFGTTYEVEEPIAVGDVVDAEYGNGHYARRIRGKVIALGSQPRVYPNGYSEPAYTGPCKRATVVHRGNVCATHLNPEPCGRCVRNAEAGL